MKFHKFEPVSLGSYITDVSFFDEIQQYNMFRIASRVINYHESDDARIVKLDAPGGFGKTHMLRDLCKMFDGLDIGYQVATFTGRAASQVSRDGFAKVQTLHSLLMKPVLDEEGNLIKFEDKLDSEVAGAIGHVLMCDEASMIPRSMFNRMHRICIAHRIIFVVIGDREQLPSIEPANSLQFDLLRRDDIDFESLALEVNYRQKEGSAIADLCMHLRQVNSIPRKKTDDLCIRLKNKVYTVSFHEENQFDGIICGIHKTRRRINSLVRRARGHHEEIAEIGEIVMCKRNDIVSNVKINNGELYRVESVFPSRRNGFHSYMMKSVDVANKRVTVNVPDAAWDGDLSMGRKLGDFSVHQFEFGYCMTCHSAQGSQFDNLLFIDEDVSFFLDQKRFRYTAVSRAKQKLTVAM